MEMYVERQISYSSPDIVRMMKSRRMRWVGHVACLGDMRNAYTILVRKSEGRRPLGRTGRRWKANYVTGHINCHVNIFIVTNVVKQRDRYETGPNL
jgi:hypothetical protein